VQLPANLRRPLYAAWRVAPFPVRWLAIRVTVARLPIGAGLLLFDGEGRLLLVRPSYVRESVWTVPGGWVKRGEEPRDAAVREAREELGVRVTCGPAVAAGRGMYGEVTVVYEAHWDGSQPLALDAELSDARFFAPGDLPPLSGQARALIEAALVSRPGR
jgi:ADP-ribose pyrophosphatase YjhB (NUDIX family)